MGLPSLSSPDLWGKIRRKLGSYTKAVRRTDEGIIVVSPPVLPFYSSPAGRALNKRLLTAQIKMLMINYDMRDPVLWIAIPTARDVVGALGESALIYQVSDKYEANRMDHATGAGVIREMHQDLLNRAGLIYYSGRKLFEEDLAAHPEIGSRARMLEQAVDFEHFSSATSRTWDEPEDIAGVRRPRLGYFGAIESWLLDQNLIRYISEKRPDWQWVLLGLKAARLDIEDLPNVHYLGSKPYSRMAEYAAAFDVCVLPWVTDNDFVSYGSAIKVREYMATGKPVVITPLYEYERFDGLLRIARGYDDFIAKVEDALSNDDDVKRKTRQDAIRDATWDARAEQVSADILKIVAGDR
jgi:glycosyltransferase involved in cell wall biosynthesis